MIIGICLKVPALPTPVKKNMRSIAVRKTGNWSGWVGSRKSAAQPSVTAMPTPETKVHRAPPNLSHRGPQAKRTSEPMSGPRKAYPAPAGRPSMPLKALSLP